MDDSVLETCNETELLAIAHSQGLGRLRRGMARLTLIQLVRGDINPGTEHLADTRHSRKMLEDFITKHWEQARSQLPGCNGKCTTFPCSEGRHAVCFGANKNTVAIR